MECYLTNNEKDLKAQLFLFQWFRCGRLEEYVLTSSYIRLAVAQIWSSLLMLLTYGILSPYAAVAVGVSAGVQIQLLRANICRYYNLQNSNKDGTNDLEAICKQSQNTVHAMLWPGVTLSTILLSLFVFDMAYDTDELSIEAPLSVLILTLLTIPLSRFACKASYDILWKCLMLSTHLHFLQMAKPTQHNLF